MNNDIKRELAAVAERFEMTKTQTLEHIIHKIYVSGINGCGFDRAVELIECYDDEYGNSYVPDEIPAIEYEEEPEF